MLGHRALTCHRSGPGLAPRPGPHLPSPASQAVSAPGSARALSPPLPSPPLGNLSPSFNQEPDARRGSPGPPAVHTCPPTGPRRPAHPFCRSGPKSESPWPFLTLTSAREQAQLTLTSKQSQDPPPSHCARISRSISAGHLRTVPAPPGSLDRLAAQLPGLSSESPRPCRSAVSAPSSSHLRGRRECAAALKAWLAPDRTPCPLAGAPAGHALLRQPATPLPTQHGTCRGPGTSGRLTPRRGAFCGIYRFVTH